MPTPPEADQSPRPQAADRLGAVLTPVIPLVGQLMARRPGCLSLAQGMVGWGPPPEVHQALRQALDRAAADPEQAVALDRYGPVVGDPALLAAIEAELRQRWGLDLEGSSLLVTAGSNMAFNALAQVICDPGDEVILPAPYYFNHVMAVQLAGGVPVTPAAGLIPDPDRLAAAITPRTRAIVTISPNNPSGVVIPLSVLAEVNALCARHGLFHISDEAYAVFVHGDEPHWSPAAAPGAGAHTITLHSLSKSHGMAGWRLGYATVPTALMAALAKVQDTILICPPRLVQQAAIAALSSAPTWLEERLKTLRQRRRQLLEALQNAQGPGLAAHLLAVPDGAFYALLTVETDRSGEALVEQLILEHGVAALPGESFGLAAEAGTAVLRLSYGLLDGPTLAEALGRLLTGVGPHGH
ncbi:MAG: aminotransferase class I/II-fold pyridoxal phosphate-dependent enzyme [Synechococcaceae cyanobacterium ELA739]